MTRHRWAVGVLVVALVLVALAPASADSRRGNKGGPDVTVTTLHRVDQDGYCFSAGLVFGDVRIAVGCYTFYVFNTVRGPYLAVGPRGKAMIPPGQLVRMNTPAGPKVKGRIHYWIPLRGSVIGIPVDGIRYVQPQIMTSGFSLQIAMPGLYVGVVSGTFLR